VKLNLTIRVQKGRDKGSGGVDRKGMWILCG